jgi:hypothetical protein
MQIVLRAFPVTQGKDEMMKFIEELTQLRASEVDAFYRRFGVSREVVFWQETPHGAQIIVCTQLADLTEIPEAYAKADEPFESWFKQEILRLTGVDLNQMPLGPPSEKIFEWAEVERKGSDASDA